MYRKSLPSDCPTIYALICDMERKSLPYEDFCGIFAAQLSDEQYYCLVCTSDDELLGFVNLRFEQQLHHCETIAEMMEFVVAAPHRRKGVGSALLREACRLCSKRGCAQIEVACNQLRHDTHRFYLRQGMHNFHYKFSKRLVGTDVPVNELGR